MKTVYTRSKVQGKNEISEQAAWTSIAFQAGLNKSQLIRTEHTDTKWVFVVERVQRALHRVSKYKSS